MVHCNAKPQEKVFVQCNHNSRLGSDSGVTASATPTRAKKELLYYIKTIPLPCSGAYRCVLR